MKVGNLLKLAIMRWPENNSLVLSTSFVPSFWDSHQECGVSSSSSHKSDPAGFTDHWKASDSPAPLNLSPYSQSKSQTQELRQLRFSLDQRQR